MPISSSDIQKFLSGGSANTNPNASLGGIISNTQIVDNTLNNLFDVVVGSESKAGDVEYRCYYVKNNHATLTLMNPGVYIQSNTPSPTTEVKVSVASEVGSPVQSIPNENTAPATQTFVLADGEANIVTFGDLAPGEVKAIWVEWTIGADTEAILDQVEIVVRGDTNP
jgi:hypothetical protein